MRSTNALTSYVSGAGVRTGSGSSKARSAASKAASEGVGGGKPLAGGAFFARLLEVVEVERDFLVALLQRRIV